MAALRLWMLSRNSGDCQVFVANMAVLLSAADPFVSIGPEEDSNAIEGGIMECGGGGGL